MISSQHIHPVLRIPPPLLFVATFFIGVGLQHIAPIIGQTGLGVHRLGLGLIGGAIAFALYSVRTFLAARTTLVPFGEASKLVTWGPYRFTRNPMYVSLVLAYVGAAAVSSQLFALVLVCLPLFLVSKFVIPFEEDRMRQVFGADYGSYCARVRRWL